MEKYVYLFSEGNKDMKELLGGKGANLCDMTSLNLPVPQGFIVTTKACNKYYEEEKTINKKIEEQILETLTKLEQTTNKKFGDVDNPLLVSVRSGARVSMPGMMDTILNLGLNDDVAKKYALRTHNPRFIYDSYRRLIQMYADVVKECPKSHFEKIIDEYKDKAQVTLDTELNAGNMYELTLLFKKEYKKLTNEEFPQDPKIQLIESIKAVFDSWMNERAIYYRKLNEIDDSWGTAVDVQEMVYGNLGLTSGTGVAFTRNPATGENKLFGEYLFNAQGEDVVAGIRTPESIETLKDIMPEIYNQFASIATTLEKHYKDMQDMEFTIENQKLYMLQTRNGKRTAHAAIKVAVDLVNEGIITKEEALMRVEPKQLDQLLHKMFDDTEVKNLTPITHGLAASPGCATGKIYFTASDVTNAKKQGIDAILVRLETSPEDIEGMENALGILTIRGGMTSHAAVVARGMGRCCVSGCSEFIIDEDNKQLKINDLVFNEGDYISLDGSIGAVYKEKITLIEPTISGDFDIFMKWADEVRTLKIKTNADNKKDALKALEYGAEGIGLCRTEHMFFEEKRIFNFRQMILAKTKEQRLKALEAILPYQQSDFEDLFEVMDSKSVIIRYLDPPLHEFLPHTEEEIKELADSLNMEYATLVETINSLKEFNPMMGHRGVRLAITYPEIAEMQTEAVIKATINSHKKRIKVTPEIMIPLVGDIKELDYIKQIVENKILEITNKENIELEYKIGTMIEVPRACMLADVIAKNADFFSFGTNDLTQMTYGFSRDDASKFLNDYYDKHIFNFDPFVKIDQEGVGLLMKEAVKLAKQVKPNIELGICGEHGGEASSVEFCHKIGLDYVSCSPYRVVQARLAAAQAVLKEKSN